MYKLLNIGGEDYKLEYSVEASLYGDCVLKLISIMTDLEIAGDKNDIKGILSGISNIPQTTLTLFYAGLMEAHGTHLDGDGKVPNIQTAKRLIVQYIKEHENDEIGNFYGIMQLCIEQIIEDGFLKLVGLEAMTKSVTDKTNKISKIPQERKKVSEK